MEFSDVQAINLLARLADYGQAYPAEVNAGMTISELVDDLAVSLDGSIFSSAPHQTARAKEAWALV